MRQMPPSLWTSLRASTSTLRPATAARRQFTCSSCLRRAFKEGDVVILRDRRDASDGGVLVTLRQSKTAHTHRGGIPHADIIGKEPRQLVDSSKGTAYRIHEPTLAEYVRLTPRLVTPIYPSDANLIISLLDIHVDTPHNAIASGPPLEILETGTGHGALTLHLSRAIHAANTPVPRSPLYHVDAQEEPEDVVYLGESVADLQHSTMESWKKTRHAIVHTLDISSKHSTHAQKIVSGFRGGMYAGNVDFHVGDVSAWIADQKKARQSGAPFLTHVFLDLPNSHHHVANVAEVLHVNGLLAVFNPSITQIVDCVDVIREQRLPYLLDQVIELGASTIREWDVRHVRPRATLKKVTTGGLSEVCHEAPIDPVAGQRARDEELAESLAKKKDKQEGEEEQWAMVCRPKAGQQVVGGGFLGLWRRMEQTAYGERRAAKTRE